MTGLFRKSRSDSFSLELQEYEQDLKDPENGLFVGIQKLDRFFTRQTKVENEQILMTEPNTGVISEFKALETLVLNFEE